MYLYYWPPEFGIIIAIVAMVLGLAYLIKCAPKVLLGVFAVIALPFYLLFSIINRCRNENGKK